MHHGTEHLGDRLAHDLETLKLLLLLLLLQWIGILVVDRHHHVMLVVRLVRVLVLHLLHLLHLLLLIGWRRVSVHWFQLLLVVLKLIVGRNIMIWLNIHGFRICWVVVLVIFRRLLLILVLVLLLLLLLLLHFLRILRKLCLWASLVVRWSSLYFVRLMIQDVIVHSMIIEHLIYLWMLLLLYPSLCISHH